MPARDRQHKGQRWQEQSVSCHTLLVRFVLASTQTKQEEPNPTTTFPQLPQFALECENFDRGFLAACPGFAFFIDTESSSSPDVRVRITRPRRSRPTLFHL